MTFTQNHGTLLKIENAREGVVCANAWQVNILAGDGLACLKKRDSCITPVAIHGLYFCKKPKYLPVGAILGFFLLQITSDKGECTMNLLELSLIAVGLSADAFAVAVCYGLAMPKVPIKKALIIGLYFGLFQAGMPLIGYLFATRFADKIVAFDHWIAFVLLGFIGGKMMVDSFKKEGCPDRICPTGVCKDRECPGGERPGTKEVSLKPSEMLPLALATSIDALAVGVSFAFLQVEILPAVLSIGGITLILSMVGVKIGNIFGARFKSKAELAGGILLVLMGLKILLEHTGVINI